MHTTLVLKQVDSISDVIRSEGTEKNVLHLPVLLVHEAAKLDFKV